MTNKPPKKLPLGEQPREWLPARKWMPKYQRRWLKGDITAGAVVAALALPQALGYATIAGLPVQVGLYSLPTVLVCYAILGTSRLLIVGPVSTVAVLTGSLIKGFAPASEAEAIAIAAGMAIAAGIILMIASVLHVGWVAEFLSKPIVTGFVLGLTILVVIGELPNILGIPVPPGDVLERIQDLVTGLDEIQTQTAVVGISALAVMFVGSRLAPRVPWALVTLVAGLVISGALDLASKGVAVVGEVPQGLPTPSVPDVPLDQMSAIFVAGAAIAFVGLAEGLSAARLFCKALALNGDFQPLLLELRHHVFESLAFLSKQIGGRDPAILEEKLSRVLHVIAHLFQLSALYKTRGAVLNIKQAYPPVAL